MPLFGPGNDLCGLDACLRRSENLGEFRIRGLQIGLYLRNISNENLGVAKVIGILLNSIRGRGRNLSSR